MERMETADGSAGRTCAAPKCKGQLEPFDHRPDDGVRNKNPKLCKINQLPLDSHRCVVECTVRTSICPDCRLVQGPETSIHRPSAAK